MYSVEEAANVSECLSPNWAQLFLAPILHLRHPPESEIRKLFQFGFGSWWIDAQAYIGSHIHIHCTLIRPYITKYDTTCCTAADFNIAENYNAKDDGSDKGYDDVD